MSASVLVAQSAADGWNVDAGFNASRREEMTEIVVGKTRITQPSARGAQTLLGVMDLGDRIRRLRTGLIPQPQQQRSQSVGHRDCPVLVVLGADLASGDRERIAVEIHVGPAQRRGFLNPAA